MDKLPVVIVGGGPAGLGAALRLTELGLGSIILERAGQVGGLARTERFHGYRLDVGGHRFWTKVPEVQRTWEQTLGGDFLEVERLSRILYNGSFYRYPIRPLDTFRNLGVVESGLIAASYVRARLSPRGTEKSFEDWVVNRFGSRLYQRFFKTYTEKVWGLRCDQISAEWASQRIRGLSLKTAICNALFGTNGIKTLINRFSYPRLGPGMMWERIQQQVETSGCQVRLNTEVCQFNRSANRIRSVLCVNGADPVEFKGNQFVSSMPLPQLIQSLKPRPPEAVLRAARGLKFRAFVIVGLIIERKSVFPDNWIYLHSPEVKAGRIQNFKNWSSEMVPDPEKTCLGVEYFCSEGDELWSMTDAEFKELACSELVKLGLIAPGQVEDGIVVRESKAYPVYDSEYQDHLRVIRRFLKTLENLQTVGRNGMHRYNNQDHAMLTGMLAADNIVGNRHDLWAVNTERSYHEEMEIRAGSRGLVPPQNPRLQGRFGPGITRPFNETVEY